MFSTITVWLVDKPYKNSNIIFEEEKTFVTQTYDILKIQGLEISSIMCLQIRNKLLIYFKLSKNA